MDITRKTTTTLILEEPELNEFMEVITVAKMALDYFITMHSSIDKVAMDCRQSFEFLTKFQSDLYN